jgi:hypothetical protein
MQHRDDIQIARLPGKRAIFYFKKLYDPNNIKTEKQ